MGLRKVCDQYRPYSNCVTLRGQLSNWTSEDIVEVAKKNIETIIEPIKGELVEQTIWDKIGETGSGDTGATLPDGVVEFGSIGDSLKDEEYQWEMIKEEKEESYEWSKL